MTEQQTTSTNTKPIFFDDSGKRLTKFLCGVVVLCMIVMAGAAWLTPRQLSPLWQATANTSAAYPDELVVSTDRMPIIGEGLFTRVDAVRTRNNTTYLTDPFTNTTVRTATPQEVLRIGTSTHVMEKFGNLPDHQIALTFDDGPSGRYTPQLLDILSKNGIPATFFIIGVNALQEPAVVSRMVREGHMVGSHTITHPELDEHGSMRRREELIGTDRIIRRVAGYASRIYRLPYANENENLLSILTGQQLGYLHVGFDVDTDDWRYKQSQPIPMPKLDGKGHVILMHDAGGDRTQTLTLVQRLIQTARAQGYTFVTAEQFLPAQYKPKRIAAHIDDTMTTVGLWTMLVGSRRTDNLLRYGATPATLLVIVYLLVAIVKRCRKKPVDMPQPGQLPPVSIVIPAHNEEQTLPASLYNLALTTHTDFEVLVVENGSTDDTWGVMRDFASIWPKMRALRSPPGKANALNTGIREARHDVIVTMDADTKFEPGTVTNLSRHFTDENVGVVAGNIKVSNPHNLLACFQQLEYLLGIQVTRLVEGVMVAPGACAAMRRHAILETGGIHGDTLAEDFDATLRIRRAGWRAVHDSEAVSRTEVPETLRGFWRQRTRWGYGSLQVLWKNRSMILRTRYGGLGMYALPYAALSISMSVLLTPLIYLSIIFGILAGNWRNVTFFLLLVIAINMATAITATVIGKERWKYVLVVPLYRLMYEPLRLCILYVVILKVIRGQALQWFSPRTKSAAMTPV